MPFNQTGPNAQANIDTYIDVVIKRLKVITINQITDTEKQKKIQLVVTLPRAQASREYYQTMKKSGPCFEGTRVILLEEMKGWATGSGESKMYALSGLAGIGKSTVAYTVATWANDHGLLGASFFFSRDEADRRSVQRFFTTLAYQLCLYDEEFANAIEDVLITKRGSAATTGTPQDQIEMLILEPLRGIAPLCGRQVLIVVDALDECDARDARLVLEGLRRMVQDLPSFKVILTTRPKPIVDHDFATLTGHKIFHMQDIEDKIVNDDIRLYLKHSLSLERVQAHLEYLTEEWCASDAEIESLVQAAGKLFIIASTAVRFILDDHWSDPAGRMKTLLDAFAQNRAFNDLSHFYTTILRSAIPADCHDQHLVERYQIVIGTIVLIQVPLSVDSLASLTNIDAKHISIVLLQLQSVVLVGTDKIPIIYHKSFSDYITDSACCKDINLRIDPMTRHTWIAMRCFKINGNLKYNMLGLESLARYMDNKEGLAHQGISVGQLQEKIPSGLRYGCVFWADHLEGANVKDTGLMEALENFVNVHMLHWLETLSLIKRLDSGYHSIRIALKLVPTPSDLFLLLSDGLRFISKFYQIIERSALHTYYSALPFTPKESLLFRRYHKEAADSICQVTGGPERWGAHLATPYTGDLIEDRTPYVQFSPDGTMFVLWDDSWSCGKSVKFWDAHTGAPVSTISLDFDRAAISNDISLLASAKNSIITLYSVKSNKPIATFTARTKCRALAISSANNRLAAWLENGTVCLWDISEGKLIASLDGFEEASAVFTFSPTGIRLVYMPYHDGAMQLRDGINGALIENIDDQSDERHKLVFSHDSSRFAVLTGQALSLYRSEDGELVGAALDAGGGQSAALAISASGSLLATGYYCVKLWSGNSGKPPMLIHELDIQLNDESLPLVFAGDDILAIGTFTNIIFYDISNRSVTSTLPISLLVSLAFSPDCTRLAALRLTSHMHLWDVQSIKVSNPPSKGQAKQIRELAFSSDCAHLACYFESHAIEIWETGRTKRRITVQHHEDYSYRSCSFVFSPDGSKFAASVGNGSIKLWNSDDGALIGSVQYPGTGTSDMELIVTLSDRMLAASGKDGDIVLWDLITLDPVGTVKQLVGAFRKGGLRKLLSFSNNGDLLAFYNSTQFLCHLNILMRDSCDSHNNMEDSVAVIDVAKLTVIATFHIQDSYYINEMAFLPDNSQLVALFYCTRFGSFNLVSNEVIYDYRLTLDQLAQFRYLPIWRGIPLRLSREHDEVFPRIVGLLPHHKDPVPVLWIPTDLQIVSWEHGPSMIALACHDGQVIFIQPSSSSVE